MKSRLFRRLVLLLGICSLLIVPTVTSFGRPPGGDRGRIVMKFSPVLGDYVALSVAIDGSTPRPFTKGHVFAQYLPAGPHEISVYRNGRGFDAWHGTVNVRPGQTDSYLVNYGVNQIVLERVRGATRFTQR